MSSSRGSLEPDRDELLRFVNAAFVHASEGGFVALRAFYDDEAAKRQKPKPLKIAPVQLNGAGLDHLVEAAFSLAVHAAQIKRPAVFCPPVATFKGNKADEASLLEGLVLSLELDEHAAASLAALRALLGAPTLVVASGGCWVDRDTGEIQDKLHVHWRLKEPTRTPAEHARLKLARTLACELVGADATAKPVVHPLRWPGSVHRKDPASPRLCRIVEENDSEIALEEALAELEGIAALRPPNRTCLAVARRPSACHLRAHGSTPCF